MAHDESHENPFAVPGAPAPTVGSYDVNGCRMYAEVRGTGPSLLIIGAASDDAEMFRPIAERLTGFTVVTWDPRGTLRSSRDGWPCDSHTHAEDAAALLRALGLAPAAIFGASAGGIVAVRLALRHPELVRQVLVYEPGFFRTTAAGTAVLARATDAAAEYLRDHQDDWSGAVTQVARVAAQDSAAARTGPAEDARPGPLDVPVGLEWYTERGAALAENFVRDDLPRTQETLEGEDLSTSDADIRFAFGTASAPVFREVAEELTRLRRRPGGDDPRAPDRIAGAGHVAYFTPDPVAGYIRSRLPG